MFENSVLKRIFGPKSGEIIRHDEEFHNFKSSQNIIIMIKSSGVRLAGHAASMGENACRVLVGGSEGKRPLRRPRRRGGIILKWIVEKLDRMSTGFTWLRTGTSGGLL
jgi:hypothetical protein